MEKFLGTLYDGLSNGSIYALLALGLVIVYRGTGHLNFAQGEMALFATYFTWQVFDWGLPIGLALIVGILVGFALGAGTEVFLVRPVGRKSPFAVFIVSLALFTGLNWLDGALWGTEGQPLNDQSGYPRLFPGDDKSFIDLGAPWRYKYLGALLVVLVLTALLFALFKYTKLGLAMRAVASNPDSAVLVGIPTHRVLMFSWGLAAAIGALGGVLVAGIQGSVSLGMMFFIFIYASAAATLGGFDSPGGAVIAGLAIGVIENFAATYAPRWIGQDMKLAVAFVLILVVLLVKPSGLFGTSKVERV